MKNIARIALGVWVILWLVFEIRPLIKERRLAQYRALIGRPLEARRAIVYGERLCGFLNFAKAKLPQGAAYKFIGPASGSIDFVRADYYLYPLLRSEEPDFILVYNLSGFKRTGYGLFASLDDKNFIMKSE
jgi:hypothetical protein